MPCGWEGNRMGTYLAWESTATLRLLGGARGLGRPRGGGEGRGILFVSPRAQLVSNACISEYRCILYSVFCLDLDRLFATIVTRLGVFEAPQRVLGFRLGLEAQILCLDFGIKVAFWGNALNIAACSHELATRSYFPHLSRVN